MDSYNFWQDFFDTYQSLSDWIKALWVIAPPAFVLTVIWLIARLRRERRATERKVPGKLIYSVCRDGEHFILTVDHSTLEQLAAAVGVSAATTGEVELGKSARLFEQQKR